MPHIHELIDFTAEVFVVHGDRVLLRRHDKLGIWLSVGGHVELDEDPTEAAVREVREEVGLDVELWDPAGLAEDHGDGSRDLVPPRFLNRHRITTRHEHVTLVYFARSASDAVCPRPGEAETEWRWFGRDELDDPRYGLHPTVRRYAVAALAELTVAGERT